MNLTKQLPCGCFSPVLSVFLLLFPEPARAAEKLRCVEPNEATGTSMAVVVDPVPLVHTGQLLPLDAEGKLLGKGDASVQVNRVLDNLDAVLKAAQTGREHVVKLNVQVKGPAVV